MKVIKYRVGNELYIDIIPNDDEIEALEDGYVIAENTTLGEETINIGLKYNGVLNALSQKQVKEGLFRECTP